MNKIKIKYTGTNIGEYNTSTNFSAKEYIFEFIPVFDNEKKVTGIEFLFDYPEFNYAPTLKLYFIENEIVSNVGDYSFHLITCIELDAEKTILVGSLCKLDIAKQIVDNFSFLVYLKEVKFSEIFSSSDFYWNIRDIK